MQRNALYYPHIGLKDPSWVKAMSMLYDNIYRMVPDEVIPEDNLDLKPLLEEGSVGRMVDPSIYSAEASEEFLDGLELWGAAALKAPSEDENQLTNLHEDKTDKRVKDLFMEAGYEYKNEWIRVPTELAANFMLYLASHVSKKNNLALITREWGAWTGVTYFNLNGSIDETFTHNFLEEGVEDPFALFCFLVSEIFPMNISEIPSEDILKFREKRAGRLNLRSQQPSP